MSHRAMVTTAGQTVEIHEDLVAALQSSLRGSLLAPGDEEYDDCRAIWNAMIDRRPGLIVRCAGAADVIRAVQFARANDVLLTVRGAGHNIAGNSISNGGLLIDLSGMKSVQVNPSDRTVRVEPGVTLGDLDNETQQFSLAVPVGINSTTGVAGLALGGGFGWLSRSYGLTADNLLSADVVTAGGEFLTASKEENADLFWGLQGGGGNFGIVTSFTFAAHPVGPDVLSGLLVYPIEDAPAVLHNYREFVSTAPDELTVWVVMRKAPPLPFLAEEVHGSTVLILAVLYNGSIADGEKALQPLREFGSPHADVISPHVFTAFQQAFDPLLTPGLRNYWKSHDFLALDDGLIDTLLKHAGNIPNGHSEIFIAQMGGATNRVPADATAYVHRDAEFIMNVHGRWESAEEDDAVIGWSRALFNDAAPFATGGVYVNFMTEEEHARVQSAYGASYERLVALKQKYDPENVFRFNQNISPGKSS